MRVVRAVPKRACRLADDRLLPCWPFLAFFFFLHWPPRADRSSVRPDPHSALVPATLGVPNRCHVQALECVTV
jgi:hypothetical protein